MAQTRGSGFNTVAMIVAFIAIGAFLYWLSIATEPAEVAVAEEEASVQPVTLGAFAQNPPMYQGTMIRMEAVPVERLFGERSFLTVFPDSTPYLVTYGPELADVGVQVVPGASATVVGTVEAIDDSLFQTWVADSLFMSEAEQEAVAAAGSRFMAEIVEVVGGTGAMDADTAAGATEETPADAGAEP